MSSEQPKTDGPPPCPSLSISFPPSLAPFNRSVGEYLSANYPQDKYQGIGTSAVVFDSRNRVLLMRRAAHDSMPGLWEPPGGGADEEDASLLVGCARELWEEARLVATGAVKILSDGEGKAPGTEIQNRTGTVTFIKFGFEFRVKGTEKGEGDDGSGVPEVILDMNEHDAFVWAEEEEVRNEKVEGWEGGIRLTTPETKEMVLEAFRRRRVEEVEEATECVQAD